MRKRIELYIDKAGERRWRKKVGGIKTGASSEGYTGWGHCLENLEEEQNGTFYRDRIRGLDADRPFIHGRRRVGVLRRDRGGVLEEITVVEVERRVP